MAGILVKGVAIISLTMPIHRTAKDGDWYIYP